MPRYNLNQDDVHIISESLTHSMSLCSSTKQWERMKKLKDRLISKVDNIERPVISDDPVWNFYNRKRT